MRATNKKMRKECRKRDDFKKCLKSKEYYHRFPTEKRKKGEITFLTLDSCVIFEMIKIIKGKVRVKDGKLCSIYHATLKRIMDSNVYNADGTRNPNGRYALCITPTVREEMYYKNGGIDRELKNFLDKRIISLDVAPENMLVFKKKVLKLVQEYKNKGIFVDDNGNAVADTKIVAESSIFNLTLLSGDKLIIKNFQEKEPEKKIEQLKSINRRLIGGDFNGYQAIPRSPRSALGMVANGKKLSSPENLTVTTFETQAKIYNELKYISHKDYVRNII